MTPQERRRNRQRFLQLCLESGYPEGVYPGASFRSDQPMCGNMQALPTRDDEYREDRLFRVLPEYRR